MNDGNGEACLICHEPSVGKHYGCQSCLGCKTFFRRAVIQQQNTMCMKPGSCELKISARQLCRSCRYRRCLECGMRPNALQPQRDLIGSRKNKRHGINSNMKLYVNVRSLNLVMTKSSFNSYVPFSSNKSRNEELLCLVSYLTFSDQTIREKKHEFIRSKTKIDKEISEPSIPKKLMIQLGSDISYVTSCEIMALFEWLQTVPGFLDLSLDDRTVLLKRFAINHLILEYGYYTAQFGLDDVWLISNGTCMPRDISILSEESKLEIPEDRKWRQEKLYKNMTNRCIDEVVRPLRRLQLTSEELVTLKVIMFYTCGTYQHIKRETCISNQSSYVLMSWKNLVIKALFEFYEVSGREKYEERFGNMILLISGIVSAASAMLESYQVMRLFKIVPFDQICEQILFDAE